MMTFEEANLELIKYDIGLENKRVEATDAFNIKQVFDICSICINRKDCKSRLICKGTVASCNFWGTY